MAPAKHVHKYHKITTKHRILWACAAPKCSHYMPADLTETLPGKASICWKCGSEFILDDDNMKNNKPICADCNPTIKSMAELLTDFGVK